MPFWGVSARFFGSEGTVGLCNGHATALCRARNRHFLEGGGKVILNRLPNGQFELPADGWFHLSPKGEFPGEREFDDGTVEEVLQIVDDASLKALVQDFEQKAAAPNFGGLLVDFDHFSHDKTKSSEAAGWVVGVQNRADGLWGKINLSDTGEAALKGGRYRFISPVWDGPDISKGKMRPTIIDRAGLTNDPNLRGALPLSNRRGGTAETKSGNNPDETKGKTTMTKVNSILGLKPDASEDAAVAEIGVIKNRAGLYDSLKTEHDTLVESVAESDLTASGITDAEERKALKPLLITNRASALVLLAKSKVKAPVTPVAQPIHNRGTAKTPGPTGDQAADDTAAEKVSAGRIANRANELFTANRSRGYRACFEQARTEEGASK